MQSVFFLALLAYALAFLVLWLQVHERLLRAQLLIVPLLFIGLILHGLLLHRGIDTSAGQNLAPGIMASFLVWLVGVFLGFASFFRRCRLLLLLLLPLLLVVMGVGYGYPGKQVVQLGVRPVDLTHALLSLFSIAILFVAALHSLAISVHRVLLKRYYHGVFSQAVTPLDRLERGLFVSVTVGFICLSVVIGSSLIAYWGHILWDVHMWLKASLVGLAWCFFAVLLVGHYHLGWRGRVASVLIQAGVWILVAVFLLSVSTKGVW